MEAAAFHADFINIVRMPLALMKLQVSCLCVLSPETCSKHQLIDKDMFNSINSNLCIGC